MGLEDQHIRGGVDSLSAPQVANPLTARMHKGINTTLDEGQTLIANGGVIDVAHALRGEGFDASEDGTGRGTPIVPVVDNAVQGRAGEPEGAQVNPVAFDSKSSSPQALEDGVAPTLRAMNHANSHANSHANAGGQLAIAFAHQAGGKQTTLGATGDGSCQTLSTTQTPAVAFDMRGREGVAMPEGPHQTANIRAASGGSSRSYVATSRAVRRLTPTECERLQGFPDGYTSIPYRTTKKVSAAELLYIHLTHPGISMEDARRLAADGPRYKALGNSMATNAMEIIGERIELVREVLAEVAP